MQAPPSYLTWPQSLQIEFCNGVAVGLCRQGCLDDLPWLYGVIRLTVLLHGYRVYLGPTHDWQAGQNLPNYQV